MAANSKVNRIVGLSLAAAVAGTFTLMPVAKAQTDTPTTEPTTVEATVTETEPTSSTAQSTVTETASTTPTTTSTKSWAELLEELAGLIVPATATGSGSADVEYTSGGKTYTALASNPKNGRLYAISTETGNLLRIQPEKGRVKDLGEIPGLEDKEITSAAFNNEGTLVLFDGSAIHTIDLSDDKAGSGEPDLTPETKDINVEGLELPKAWAPGEGTELVGLSTTKDGEATRYILNFDDEKATVEDDAVTVLDTVNLSKVDPFTYAYLDGETVVFADETGHAVTLKGDELVSANSGRTVTDNYKAIAGLQEKPTTTPSSKAAPESTAPVAEEPAQSEKPANTTPTTTTPAEDSVEPVATSVTSATTTTKDADNSDNLIEIDVLVKTADDKVVEGAEFKSDDGTVAGTTGADGRGKIYLDPKKENVSLIRLTLKEPPKGYNNTEVTIRRSDGKAELVLPRDSKATPSSTLNRPDRILKALDEAKPIASSFLAPAAAMAGAAGLAGAGGSKSTRTTFGGTKVTSTTSTSKSSRSVGRSTSVAPSKRVVTRNSNSTAVAKAKNTSTRATSTDRDTDERDGDLADTGTPMRAIIALGVLAMLIGGAYLALGRRRENA